LYIKHRPSFPFGFAKLDGVYDFHIHDRLFEDPFKKGIEHEYEQVFALLVCECFFEGEIKRERSEPGLRSGLGIGNKRFYGHNTSFKRDKVNGNRILYKKSAIMPYVTCLNIENSYGGVKAKHYSVCNWEAKQ
jgi:hypothetical protein